MELKYPALKARLQQLKAEIERVRSCERELAIEEILRLLASVDLEPKDLRRYLQEEARSAKSHLMRGAPKPIAQVAERQPQFIDPATGRSWSGHGRRPKWLTGNIERFRVVGF